MKNKEQLLYFFLQGKISLSQYDYKFMANLLGMIQNKDRVTTNQADLLDKLISKYKKQLIKNNYNCDELKQLPWKTMVVESTTEYTGAYVSINDDTLTIRVPFNKSFIAMFRSIPNNTFAWDGDSKLYTAKFSTMSLKIAYTVLPKYFNSVRYDDELQDILNEICKYDYHVWNPTLMLVNGNLVVVAANPVIAELVSNIKLDVSMKTFYKLSTLGVTIDSSLYKDDHKLEFSAKNIYETDISEINNVVSWMKNLGCENVVLGRAMRNAYDMDELRKTIDHYGMTPLGPINFGKLPDIGITMLIQNTSTLDARNAYTGKAISKTIVLKDSSAVEVK